MGISGLTTFLDGKLCWKYVDLRNSKVLIDGGSLQGHLLNERSHQWRLGGDYPPMQAVVDRFLASLWRLGIEIYVVFDG